MILDAYTSAIISITGLIFDSIGGLYLAYDLLGGEKGPLSKVTRIVTYGLLSTLIYSLAFNFRFALICGIGLGAIFGWHLDTIGAGKTIGRKMILVTALLRMLILGFGLMTVLQPMAAWLVGSGGLIGSLFVQKLHVSPEYWYEASRKPTFNIRRIGIGVLLGCVMTVLVYTGETICGAPDKLGMSLHFGLTAGIGTGLIASLSPFVEWYADNLPPRNLGYFGAVMFMIGFCIQSVPSLCVLLGDKL